MSSNVINIYLSGRFRIIGPDGQDLTPKGEKLQGCVALLACSPSFNRSRAWIVDKLWSDRAHEQARGSLRQAIKGIRASLGPFSDVLVSTRSSLAMNSDRITVHMDGSAEFLEGIDIADNEWNNWLLWERAKSLEVPQSGSDTSSKESLDFVPLPPQLILNLRMAQSDNPIEQFVNGGVAEQFAQGVEEAFGIEASFVSNSANGPTLHVSSIMRNGNGQVSVSLRKGRGDRQFWAGRKPISPTECDGSTNLELSSLIFAGQDALFADHTQTLRGSSAANDVRVAVLQAVKDVLSFKEDRIRSAYDTLDAICSQEDNPHALAWYLFAVRALFYETPALVSHVDFDLLTTRCEKAISLAPSNSLVLSMVSATYLRILHRTEDGIALAQRAVQINQSNPFAIDAIAAACYLGEQPDKGYKLSKRAANTAKLSRFSPYFQMSQCVGATSLRYLDEANYLAVSASAVTPSLKSAWRFRLALASHRRDRASIASAKTALWKLEGNDIVGNMLENPDYPIPTIRKVGLDLTPLAELQ